MTANTIRKISNPLMLSTPGAKCLAFRRPTPIQLYRRASPGAARLSARRLLASEANLYPDRRDARMLEDRVEMCGGAGRQPLDRWRDHFRLEIGLIAVPQRHAEPRYPAHSL